jgi:hypothetical protein
MKKNIVFLLFICSQWCVAQKYWVGTTDSNWNNAANWSPGVPGTNEDVMIFAGNHMPVLPNHVNLGNLYLDWGSSIDLNGKTATVGMLTSTGATVFSNGGTIDAVRTGAYQNNTVKGTFTLKINRDGTNNYLGAQLGANTYENAFTLECHTGDWTTYGVANQYGDTYQGETTFKNIGSGWLMIASNSSSTAYFQNNVTFHNAHSYEGKIQIGVYGGKIQCEKFAFIKDETVSPYSYITISEGTFYDEVEIDTKTGVIGIGDQNTTTFKKKVTIINRYNCGFNIGSASGEVVFDKAATVAISPAVPMSRGYINFKRCTFQGDASTTNETVNLQLGGIVSPTTPSTYIYIGEQTVFNKKVNIRADYVHYKKAYFGYDVVMERIGSSGYYGGVCYGGSTFMGKADFINSYGDDWVLQGQEKDIFKGDVSYYQHSHPTGGMRLSYADATVYEGNITATIPSGATNGISWGEGGGTTQLLAGKTLTVNSSGSGWVGLANFTQVGSASNHTLNAGGSSLYINNCTFAAPLTAESARLFLNNSILFQPSFTKTGNGTDVSDGGNTFQKKVSLKNVSSNGQIQFVDQNNTIINP